MGSRTRTFTLLATCGTLLGACAPQSAEVEGGASSGAILFAERCASCHGRDARGSADLAGGLSAPDLTGLSERNGGLFPRDFVMAMIDGYDRRTQPHIAMPEFGADGLGQMIRVEDGESSTSAPVELIALTAYLETLQRP